MPWPGATFGYISLVMEMLAKEKHQYGNGSSYCAVPRRASRVRTSPGPKLITLDRGDLFLMTCFAFFRDHHRKALHMCRTLNSKN